MPPEDRNLAFVWDMLQAAREVSDMNRGVSKDVFLVDTMLCRATERSLEIIGEAARRVSSEFMQAAPEIPWRRIIGQRNILAHEYGNIDYELLAETVNRDIPELIARLEALLPHEPE